MSGRQWRVSENLHLVSMVGEGLGDQAIATALHRSLRAIVSQRQGLHDATPASGRWSGSEDRRLKAACRRGASDTTIAEAFGRRRTAVARRRLFLGLPIEVVDPSTQPGS